MIEREPRRRRGSKREVDVSEMSEVELVSLLWRRSWAWLGGQRRVEELVEATVEAVAAAPEAEAPAKRKRASRREALPEGVAALRRAAWAWFKPEAEAPAKRKRAPRREALPEGVAAFRRAAWAWLKPEEEAPAKRKRAPKREALPEGVAAFRRAAWAWLKPEEEAPAKRKRAPKREALPDGVAAFRRAAWAWLTPAAPVVEPEVPAKRKRAPKREAVPEAVATLRRAAWAWLKRAKPVVVVAPPAPAPAPPPPAPEPPKRKRAPKREAGPPVGVLELRLKAWAWFAPRATGESAAGSHLPLRLATAASVSAGNVVLTHLKGVLEALVFASEHPLPAKELARLAKTDAKVAKMLLGELVAEYHGRGFRLDEVAGGYVFRTSPLFAPFVREQVAKKPVRMSRAQLETLAIVAYRQPITRPEVDEVRGVDSGAVMKSLLERELVRIIGKKDEPGRPMLYGTTGAFLEFFGLKALGDLPTLREFTELTDESKRTYERELGEDAPEVGLMGGEGEMRRGSVDLGGVAAPVDVAALEQDGEVVVQDVVPEAPAVGEAEEGAEEQGEGDAHAHDHDHDEKDEDEEDDDEEDDEEDDEDDEDDDDDDE